MAAINITPLVDLLFLLLIFFMVTSSLNIESSIFINLPRAEVAGDYRPGTIIITVSEENEIFINDGAVKKGELTDRLLQLKERGEVDPVIIRGDRESNYQTIIDVMDTLNKTGFTEFTLSTVR